MNQSSTLYNSLFSATRPHNQPPQSGQKPARGYESITWLAQIEPMQPVRRLQPRYRVAAAVWAMLELVFWALVIPGMSKLGFVRSAVHWSWESLLVGDRKRTIWLTVILSWLGLSMGVLLGWLSGFNG